MDDLNGLDLLFGPDLSQGGIEPVVDPRRRPAPVQRPRPYGSQPQLPRQQPRSTDQAPLQAPIQQQPAQGVDGGWFNILRNSGVSTDQAQTAAQYIIDKTNNPNAPFPSSLPPGAKGNLDAYWEAYGRDAILGARNPPSAPVQQQMTPAQPMPAPQPQAQQQQPVQPDQDINGLDLLFGPDLSKQQPVEPQPAQPVPQPQQNQPDSNTGSWITGAYNYMTGADRDPRYKDLGDFDVRELLPDNPTDNAQFAPYRAARRSMLFGATDEQLGDVIELQLGNRFIRRFKDANGADLVEYRGKDGKKKTAYVNQPGANMDDVGRFAEGSLPYLTAARMAGGVGGGWLAQSVVQGTAAGGTSIAGDIVNEGAGSQQGVDPFKALVTAGFAAGAQLTAPVVGFLWRRLVREPQLFNAQTGQLTQQGERLAEQAGLDPKNITRAMAQQFSRDLARGNSAAEAGMRVVSDGEFGVPTTLGQRTKDIRQLTDEGVIKYGGYGDDAAQQYQRFSDSQTQALEDAALGSGVYQGRFKPQKESIMKTIAPEYAQYGKASKDEFGRDIAEGVKAAHTAVRGVEKQAWEGVKDIVPTLDALKTIPSIIDEAKYATGISADDIGTPTALRMIDRLDDFMQGTVNKQTGLRGRASEIPKSVDGMRRQLSNILADAQTPTDRKLAGAIYERYNNWIRRTAEQNLLTGNPEEAARLFSAVDISRKINQVYKPRGNSSKKAASKFMEKLLDDAVTPEKLVDELFGAGTKGTAKSGVKEAIYSIKSGLTTLADDEAAKTWNAIRAAYWTRVVSSKSGDVVGPQAMLTNLKTAFEQQGSIMKILYSRAEISQMQRFRQMLEGVVAPNVNSSGSGFVAISQARRGISQIVERFTGKFIADLFDRSLGGIVKGAQGSRAVAKALSQEPAQAPMPTLGGYGSAAGAGIERQPKLRRNSQRVLVPQ